MGEFTDKVVLVTGAGRGIGRAIALAFAAQRACVAVNDINPTNLDETVAQIEAAGGRAKAYLFDLAKRMPVQAMIELILQDFGRIDILVNDAAVEPHAAILDMDEWDWHRTLDVNLSGAFFTIQHAGRAMRAQGGGVIVNLGASEGRAQDLEQRAAYFASKMGLIGLTRAAAAELAAYNIRVNAICPGMIEPEAQPAPHVDEASLQERLAAIPQGRLGQRQEVVSLVLFLCSPQATYITGQAIHINGGAALCG